jgi:hypothetical protein
MAKKVIALLGSPIVTEDGVAGTATIRPGMLVGGVSTIVPFNVAGGPAPRTFALERDELGKGIDELYASGDVVKVGSFAPGMHVNAIIASGQNIAEGAWLEPAADGTLRVLASGTRIARALEAVNATAVSWARIRVEVY